MTLACGPLLARNTFTGVARRSGWVPQAHPAVKAKRAHGVGTMCLSSQCQAWLLTYCARMFCKSSYCMAASVSPLVGLSECLWGRSRLGWFVQRCACLPVSVSGCRSVCFSVSQSALCPMCRSAHLSVCLSGGLSVCRSAWLPVCLSAAHRGLKVSGPQAAAG